MPDDDELAHDLGRILAALDQPGDDVIQAAEGAWHWRSIARELATLSFDSADPELETASRGASTTVRRLSFDQANRSLDVEIDGDHLIVFAEPDGASIQCSTATSDLWAATIEAGKATGPLPPNGSVRLTLTTPDGDELLTTPWFLA